MSSDYVIMCNRCKRLFNSYSVAKCNHEAVNKHYGNRICMYCCMKCKHHKKITNPGGVTCTLNNL